MVATGFNWVEGKDAAPHPTMHGTAPFPALATQNDPAPNGNTVDDLKKENPALDLSLSDA